MIAIDGGLLGDGNDYGQYQAVEAVAAIIVYFHRSPARWAKRDCSELWMCWIWSGELLRNDNSVASYHCRNMPDGLIIGWPCPHLSMSPGRLRLGIATRLIDIWNITL